ncbi:MAG: hypothetical protein JSW41_05075 [Candidatus Aenigmatarchaeota archaeon]|nr:MAG: hypothetical protein JSW41_05075 [Candidatus Aenigmarchaeota archaeon]
MYTNFIILGKYNSIGGVPGVAKRMGVHQDTLYKWIRGVRTIPHDRISDLVKATDDPIYIMYFCSPCGYQVIPKIQDPKIIKVFSCLKDVFNNIIPDVQKESHFKASVSKKGEK